MKYDLKIVLNPSLKNSESFKKLVNSIPSIFEKEGSIIFEGRNTIKRFLVQENTSNEKEIIVKKYKKPDIIKKIGYGFFKSSKAERAFTNAIELRKRGINTPAEFAFLEERKNGFLTSSYFFSEADYSHDIYSKLNSSEDFDKDFAKAFAHFIAELHIKGIIHKDLNCTNILYKGSKNSDMSFSLIDINRMKFYHDSEHIPLNICFENLTLFTGNLDLHRYVCECYIEYRNLDDAEALLQRALKIKLKHDKGWEKRKKITRKIKKMTRRKKL